MKPVDVVVIGGGVAGVTAAAAATAAGARVALVRRGPGVSAMTAGGWIDAPPTGFADLLRAAGLPLLSCAGGLPHPEGTLLHCAAAPAAHVRAGLRGGAERALVCGIAGLPGFRAAALAALWADALDGQTDALAHETVTLDGTPSAGWSPVSLAAALERDAHLLGAPLAHAVGAHGVARVIVPAVLGLERHSAVHATVEGAVGATVGEALGTPPSLPGWRLDRALLAVLANVGAELFTGVARVADDLRVSVATATGTLSLHAGAVVLAAGKFAGGGVAADPQLRDAVRDSGAFVDFLGRRFDDAAESIVLTEAVRTATQPLLEAGADAGSDDRVFVTGSMRAGIETAALGLGAAANDGWDAGRNAAVAAARRGAP
jgi:glycerol-3-phosphate dehydrogenase subunit B